MTPASTPACPHCAAGPFAGVTYDEELAAKTRLLRRELGATTRPGASLDLERVELRPAPAREGYRNTVKLVFGWDKAARRAALSIYRPGSHQLIDLGHCREHHPALGPPIAFIAEAVGRLGLPVYHEGRAKGFLRHLLLRVLPDGRMLCCFVTPQAEGAWQEKLLILARELRAAFPALLCVTQNLNPGRGNAVLGPHTQLLEGQWSVPCLFLETPVAVSATCFLQANLEVFRLILADLRDWIRARAAEGGAPPRVADLYCGCGAIGLSVTRTEPLFLLEGEHASQIPLMEAARADGRAEIEVVRGRVEDCLTSLELFEPDLVLVDPPRKGLDPALLDHLHQRPPRALAYLSCNPATLARDLATLSQDPAWRLESLTAWDMMPGTEHVEVLALLRRE